MNWIAKLNGWAVPCADNTTLDAGSGGDTLRTEDKAGAGIKTPVSLIDVAGTGTENLVEDGVQGMPTEGVAAENAAVVGNPVLTGGRFDSTPRTLGDGDVGAIALDADGAVQISDGGNTITVDGTVTANLGATDNAVLDSIDAAVNGTLTVDGSGVTQPVSAASLPLPSGAATAAKQPALGTAGTASADVITVQGIASMTAVKVDGSGVTQPVSGTVTANLSATDNAVLDNIDTSTASSASLLGTIDADTSALAGCVGGTELQVDIVSSAAVPVTDNSGSLTVDNAGTFAVQSTLTPATSGGLDTFKSTDIDETEEDVKTSAGLLYWIYCVNTNASARYLKVYNATAANVTVGSTATKLDLLIPPSNSGFFIQFPHGITFSTAISVAATTGVGDADSGAPGANEVQVTVGYK